MSVGDDEYYDTFNPDENVLRFWYQEYHCTASTPDQLSTEKTRQNALNTIGRFERFLTAQEGEYDCHWTEISTDDLTYQSMLSPRSVTPQVAEDFLIELRENYAPQTQESTYATLNQAYGWCENYVESVEINPFEEVWKKHKQREGNWILEKGEGRDPYIIEMSEARRVVRSWEHPMWLTIQMILAKMPRRAGGISNLDVEDVHIDHPGADWSVHREVRQWPDHIIFRADKRKMEDGRNTGNKTKTDTKIPIDDELKDVLLWYLATHPKTDSPSAPLFIQQEDGRRLSGISIADRCIKKAKELNHWYGPGDDDNLNPHYWRHWGTTWYEDRFGGSLDSQDNTAMTDYLRGDSRNEIKGLYNSYSTDKQDRILDAMPTFLKPYTDD